MRPTAATEHRDPEPPVDLAEPSAAPERPVKPMHADYLRCSGSPRTSSEPQVPLDASEPSATRTHAPRVPTCFKSSARAQANNGGPLSSSNLLRFLLSDFKNFGALRPLLLG